MISAKAFGCAVVLVMWVSGAFAATTSGANGARIMSGATATSTRHVQIRGYTGDGLPPSPATGVSADADAPSPSWIAGALSLVGSEVASLQFKQPPPNLELWSVDFLAYLGVTSVGSSSPRVEFLERWAQVEGSYNHGNPNNPLDTKFVVRGDKPFNRWGVKSYPTFSIGYKATLATLQQSFDQPILAALRTPTSSMSSLALALAESNWVGFGAKSWAEQLYAAEIARVPMRSFDLPLPTVSLRGRLVDPLGRSLANVCVSALSSTAQSKGVVTSSTGSFSLPNLPRAAYRLQIIDCHNVAGNEPPFYYDAKSAPRYTTSVVSRATSLSTRCAGITACPSQHLNLRVPLEFGLLTPDLTWSPAPLSPGAALSPAQLDARSPVPGTYTYAPAEGASLGPGSHAIRVTFRPKDRRDYSIVTSTAHFQVSRGVPAVSWLPPGEIAEGTPLSESQLDATSPVPGQFVYSPAAGTVLSPGAHVLAVRFQPTDLAAYRAVVTTVVIVVTPSDSDSN